jgi:hypothetical protein
MQIRIRIQQLKLMRIHADPDPDTDPDPKPCFFLGLPCIASSFVDPHWFEVVSMRIRIQDFEY